MKRGKSRKNNRIIIEQMRGVKTVEYEPGNSAVELSASTNDFSVSGSSRSYRYTEINLESKKPSHSIKHTSPPENFRTLTIGLRVVLFPVSVVTFVAAEASDTHAPSNWTMTLESSPIEKSRTGFPQSKKRMSLGATSPL